MKAVMFWPEPEGVKVSEVLCGSFWLLVTTCAHVYARRGHGKQTCQWLHPINKYEKTEGG